MDPVTCVACGQGPFDLTPLIERAWAKTTVTPAGCWEIAGARPYPRVTAGYVAMGAHILGYIMATGHAPTRMVLHTCDNTQCWRPDHLYEGDALANNRDRRRRAPVYGRAGLDNHFAKLTAGQVAEIRALVAADPDRVLRRRDGIRLAAEYGVALNTIYRVANGLTHRADTRAAPDPRAHWSKRGIQPSFPDRKAAKR